MQRLWSIHTVLFSAFLSLVGVIGSTAAAQDANQTHLLILSGQSNMKHVDPDGAFRPWIEEAFPNDNVLVAKYAQSGKLIRLWVKDWEPPEGQKRKGSGKNGRLYDATLAEVRSVLEGQPKPDTVTLLWMQGEADSNHAGYGELYQAALNSLVTQFETDLDHTPLFVVIGRISDHGIEKPNRPDWVKVREAQEQFVAEKPELRAIVDTDDLNGKNDGLHYTKAGYATLAERLAKSAIALIRPDPSAE